MLEVVKGYEQSGKNSLRDFIAFVSDEERNETEWNIDVPKDMEAVKVMTVHKAKGLGFSCCHTAHLRQVIKGIFPCSQGDQGHGRCQFYALNQKIADMVDELGGLYDELSIKEAVNNLNSLYVALTRAESEMYVLCVKNKARKESYHFCGFLPLEEYPPAAMPSEIWPGEKRELRKIELAHRGLRALAAVSAEKSMNIEGRRWGEYIHRILSSIDSRERSRPLLREIIKR